MKTSAYWLFGNDETRQALVLHDPSFKQIEAVKAKGFKLVWDSAPSKEKAFEYAANEGDGDGLHYYEHDCRGCGFYRDVALYRGTKFSGYYERWIPFNGHLCDMCVAEDDFKVKPVK